MEEEQKTAENKQEPSEVQEAPPKKGFPINIVIIGILILCLLGGGLFVWKSDVLSKISGNEETALSEQDSKEDKGDKNDIGPIYSMDTFIVNLVGGMGKNYLKARIELEMDDIKLTEEINKRLPQFRDAILTLLSSKTNDDIRTLEGKYQLRAEIISTLNQYLGPGKIKNVFFTDFIIQ